MDQQAAVAHNLANVDATGFRAELHKLRAVEGETEALHAPSRSTPASRLHRGAAAVLGRPFDVALAGKGWLAVQMPDGSEAYTRNGSLAVSANGVSANARRQAGAGRRRAGHDPARQRITIGADGSVSASQPDQPGVVNVVAAQTGESPRRSWCVATTASSACRAGRPRRSIPMCASPGLSRGQQRQRGRPDGADDLARPSVRMQTRMLSTAEQNDRSARRSSAARADRGALRRGAARAGCVGRPAFCAPGRFD